MRLSISKESSKENNKPAAGFKTFMNVFRPIRDWLNTRPKSSTPISNGVDSGGGHGRDSAVSAIGALGEDSGGSSGIGSGSGSGGLSSGCGGGGGAPEVSQFCRTAQSRMSLPIMQQNHLRRQAYSQLQRRGQQVARSMGYIYLQHMGETKQACLPNELTTIDTIRALFVCAFPHLLSMEYMSQSHVKIYIYSPSCNIFYELCDIEDVRHESVLRIHHSDPLIPLALTSQLSMASMVSTGTAAPIYHHQHQYSTLHRLPPGPMPPIQARPGSRSSLGQPIPTHMMQSIPQQLHHSMTTQNGPPPPPANLSQIPPPKPRRMIPAGYSMHRLNQPQ